MTKQQIVLYRSPMERRLQYMLDSEQLNHGGGGRRFAEVAGGTTAECAAVICCFPCTVVNILVLAVYKVPAGLCRKALRNRRLRRRRRRVMNDGLLIGGDVSVDGMDGTEFAINPAELLAVKALTVDEEFVELENEMWETFYGTGFWRSLSQRV
ncbi:uncharacterized protein LOC143620260 [Bidens hawaiensis]|uniref:uncharacterized protein LOC143620260 n=1 Tax=Bidens hawaiensis TaxID=980011 RepID=UPI00404B8A7C